MKPKIKQYAKKACALTSLFLLLPIARIHANDQTNDTPSIRAIREDGSPVYPPTPFADLVYESLQVLPPINPPIMPSNPAASGTPDNIPNTLVQRDSLGNFAASTITADLVGAVSGAASLNVLKTGDTMTGSLTLAGLTTNLSVGGISTLRDLITTGDTAINGAISFANNVPGIAQNVLLVTQAPVQGPNEVRHPRPRRWLDGLGRLKGDWLTCFC